MTEHFDIEPIRLPRRRLGILLRVRDGSDRAILDAAEARQVAQQLIYAAQLAESHRARKIPQP